MQIIDIPIDQNQKETTVHGSFSFPIAIYQQILARNVLGYINWHWHEEIQFCCVTQGAVTFCVNERQYLLRQGEGMFVNSGFLHMAKPEGGADSAYLCLDVHPRLLAGFPGSVFERGYVTPWLKDPGLAHLHLSPEIPWQREVLDMVGQAYALHERRPFGYEWEISALAGRMWYRLLEYHPEGGGKEQGEQRMNSNAAVQAILTYLHENYAERITLDEIAKAVSFSASECCRMFRRVTGETIFDYLRAYRLAQSTRLLRQGEQSVSQIAYECGFGSTSYFIERFRNAFGQTPHRYRKNARTGEQ